MKTSGRLTVVHVTVFRSKVCKYSVLDIIYEFATAQTYENRSQHHSIGCILHECSIKENASRKRKLLMVIITIA